MDMNSIITILVCILFLWGIGKVLHLPFRKIFQFILNSIFGGILIFFINVIGSNFNFHIGLNFATAMLVGLLGIPRYYFACDTFFVFLVLMKR